MQSNLGINSGQTGQVPRLERNLDGGAGVLTGVERRIVRADARLWGGSGFV